MRDDELHRFKSDIHLLQYAIERYGYRRDRAASSRASQVLRHPTSNDKIVVRRAADGHWTYFSVRDERDNGTILDFIKERGGHRSLGPVCEELRGWFGIARPQAEWLPPPAPARDRRAIIEAFARARVSETCCYLKSRGICRETLSDPRFAPTWRLDARGNALFAHRDEQGELTGYEIKGPRFTGFAAGGTKTAWQSIAHEGDRILVITESAIDALSYHQLHPARATSSRYLSLAGAPSALQMALLLGIFATLSGPIAVVAAVDRDDAGTKLANRIADLVSAHAHLSFERHSPEADKDWNDVLRRLERGQ